MADSMRSSDWLTPADYAKKYGLHVKTVRRWCREGQIKAKRFGPRLYRVYDKEARV